jgi:predicted transposase YdaD
LARGASSSLAGAPWASYDEGAVDHDHPYKLLFSHAEMIRDLLLTFVKEDWVRELDFSALEHRPGSFVSDDLRDREDDIIWSVRWACAGSGVPGVQ